jgi:hypothetical protein
MAIVVTATNFTLTVSYDVFRLLHTRVRIWRLARVDRNNQLEERMSFHTSDNGWLAHDITPSTRYIKVELIDLKPTDVLELRRPRTILGRQVGEVREVMYVVNGYDDGEVFVERGRIGTAGQHFPEGTEVVIHRRNRA